MGFIKLPIFVFLRSYLHPHHVPWIIILELLILFRIEICGTTLIQLNLWSLVVIVVRGWVISQETERSPPLNPGVHWLIVSIRAGRSLCKTVPNVLHSVWDHSERIRRGNNGNYMQILSLVKAIYPAIFLHNFSKSFFLYALFTESLGLFIFHILIINSNHQTQYALGTFFENCLLCFLFSSLTLSFLFRGNMVVHIWIFSGFN